MSFAAARLAIAQLGMCLRWEQANLLDVNNERDRVRGIAARPEPRAEPKVKSSIAVLSLAFLVTAPARSAPPEPALVQPLAAHSPDDAEISEVLLGRAAGRRTSDEITMYKSLGHIVQDVASAACVHERARVVPER
jgi:Ornithine cyclodeaminase/mu-crystallin family